MDTPQTSFSPTPSVPPVTPLLPAPHHSNFRAKPFVWLGIAVVVLLGAWFILTSTPRTVNNVGFVFFFDTTSSPGVYAIASNTGKSTPVMTNDLLPFSGSTQIASFSSDSSYYVLSAIKNPANTPVLVVSHPWGKEAEYFPLGEQGARFENPIVSRDGKSVAYRFLSKVTAAKTKADLTAGTGTETTRVRLAYATLDGHLFTEHPFQADGTPILFSPDSKKILMRDAAGFSLVTLLDSSVQPVKGIASMAVSDNVSVAISQSGNLFALAVNGQILWGGMDWNKGVFNQQGSLQVHARAVYVNNAGELLIIDTSDASLYRLSNNTAVKETSFVLPESARLSPLGWLTPSL